MRYATVGFEVWNRSEIFQCMAERISVIYVHAASSSSREISDHWYTIVISIDALRMPSSATSTLHLECHKRRGVVLYLKTLVLSNLPHELVDRVNWSIAVSRIRPCCRVT